MKYLYMIGGNIVSAIFMWLITLYLVRVNALEDLGILSLVQSLGLLFFVFCTFKLINVQISDVKKQFSEVDYYFARVISAILCIFLITSYMLLSTYSIFIKTCCFLYSIYYGLMVLREYFSANFQINKNYKYIFLSNSLNGFLSFLFFVVTYFFTKDIVASLLGIILAGIVTIILNHSMHRNMKEIYSKFNFFKSLNLIKSNFFLGCSALLVSGLILIPRFFIENLYGLEYLGVFSALTSIMFFINIFLNSLTQVFLKETVDIYNINPKKSYKKMILNFSIIISTILILLIPFYFLRDFITVLIFGDIFLKYSNEFFYCIFLSIFLFCFNYGNFILTVQQNFNVQIYISILVFLSQLILCYLLIDSYVYFGAFISMGITYILGFFVSILFFIYKEYLK